MKFKKKNYHIDQYWCLWLYHMDMPKSNPSILFSLSSGIMYSFLVPLIWYWSDLILIQAVCFHTPYPLISARPIFQTQNIWLSAIFFFFFCYSLWYPRDTPSILRPEKDLHTVSVWSESEFLIPSGCGVMLICLFLWIFMIETTGRNLEQEKKDKICILKSLTCLNLIKISKMIYFGLICTIKN